MLWLKPRTERDQRIVQLRRCPACGVVCAHRVWKERTADNRAWWVWTECQQCQQTVARELRAVEEA